MSLTATFIVTSYDEINRARAHLYDTAVTGPIAIAAVEINGLTIQSHEPGQLARLASALIEAENQAEQLRAENGLPTSVVPAVA